MQEPNPMDASPFMIPAEHPDDAWVWQARYQGYDETDPDTYLDEYESDGTAHGFKDIDLSRLERFILIPRRPHLQTHVLAVSADVTPIFFRRRFSVVSLDTNDLVGQLAPVT